MKKCRYCKNKIPKLPVENTECYICQREMERIDDCFEVVDIRAEFAKMPNAIHIQIPCIKDIFLKLFGLSNE